MSFVGLFRARDGLAAVVDSKATVEYSPGRCEEYIGRNPNKLHLFPGGVLLVYGALQIFTENRANVFSKEIPVEQLIEEYIIKHKTIDACFFQELLWKMNSSPLNKEPARFIVGRKIWTGKYQIEHHKVGYNYYAMKIVPETEVCVVGGSALYVEAFQQMEYGNKMQSVEGLRAYAVKQLEEMITFHDKMLAYNPVGGIVKSFSIK